MPGKNQNIAQQLQREYFTREFAGYEIESKWELLGQDPVLILLRLYGEILNGIWYPFAIQRAMGRLETGIKYFKLDLHLYGIKLGNRLCQVARIAQMQGTDQCLLDFKYQGAIMCVAGVDLPHAPWIRPEFRMPHWMSFHEAEALVLAREPKAQCIGVMTREKCSTYITNVNSHRNFNISADLCYHGKKCLSQLEIEYKGRSGIWVPDSAGFGILREYSLFNWIVADRYGNIALPTTLTKFDWMMGQ